MTQTCKGTIVNWNETRGFGFIRPREGGKELFFHISDVESPGVRPQEKMGVSYSPSTDDQGRRCAIDVHLNGATLRAAGWPLLIALLFFGAIGVLGMTDILPQGVLYVYLAVSLVTVVVYRSDKARAENGSRRTPEKVLHLLELAGGWPGALVAQWTYRHKNRKASYQISFWLAVAANLALLAFVCAAGL